MTDTSTPEASPAPPPAPAQERPKRRWLAPLVGALAIVAALAVGGVGGYAIATATHAGGPPGIHHPQGYLLPGTPGEQQRGPRDDGPRPGPGDRPERPPADEDSQG